MNDLAHCFYLRLDRFYSLVVLRQVGWCPNFFSRFLLCSILAVNLLSQGLHPLNSHSCHFFLESYLISLLLSQKVILSTWVHVKGWASLFLEVGLVIQSTQVSALRGLYRLKSNMCAKSRRNIHLRVICRLGWEILIHRYRLLENFCRDLWLICLKNLSIILKVTKVFGVFLLGLDSN